MRVVLGDEGHELTLRQSDIGKPLTVLVSVGGTEPTAEEYEFSHVVYKKKEEQ